MSENNKTRRFYENEDVAHRFYIVMASIRDYPSADKDNEISAAMRKLADDAIETEFELSQGSDD